MISKRRFFKRRLLLTCITTFVDAFIGLSLTKLIFDNLITGLVIFQLYEMCASGASTMWKFYITRNRTRDIIFQQKIIPYYNSIKNFLIFIHILVASITILTGFKYYFPISFAMIALKPIKYIINNIEERVEAIIMEADNLEDMKFLSSRTAIYSSISDMAGLGLSTAILYLTNISMFPMAMCIILSNIVQLMDSIEMSKYINITMDKLVLYYKDKIDGLEIKDIYNNTILSPIEE